MDFEGKDDVPPPLEADVVANPHGIRIEPRRARELEMDPWWRDSSDELIKAAMEGRKDSVIELLTLGNVDVNMGDLNGKTPLHWATENKHLEIVRTLLDYSANRVNVHSRDKDGRTALSLTAAAREPFDPQIHIARLLREYGAQGVYFSELGFVIISEIMTFLTAKETLRLDTAMCSKSGRGDLKMAYKNLNSPGFNRHIFRSANECEDLKWVMDRGVHLQDMRMEYGSTTDRDLVLYEMVADDERMNHKDPETAQKWRRFMSFYLQHSQARNGASGSGFSNTFVEASQRGNLEVMTTLIKRARATPKEEGARHARVSTSLNMPEMINSGRHAHVKTPMVAAAGQGQLAAVALLLREGADVNKGCNGSSYTDYMSDVTPLSAAAQGGHAETVKALLDAGADVHKEYRSNIGPLWHAATLGHVEVLGALLGAGADVAPRDHHGRTALYLAAKNGRLEAARLLLAAGADVDSPTTQQETALFAAADTNRVGIVRLLLEEGAEVNRARDGGMTPLHPACYWGYTHVLQALVDSGADPDHPDDRGITPLQTACGNRHGKVAVVEILLGANADVDRANLYGNDSPLVLAAMQGLLDNVRALVKAGVDVNLGDSEHKTALHRAAANGHVEVVKALLAAGARINGPDIGGRTALHNAAFRGKEGVVLLLLATEGIEVDKTDLDGFSAMSEAQGKKHEGITALLREAGAKEPTKIPLYGDYAKFPNANKHIAFDD